MNTGGALMFESVQTAWKIKELRQRIFFTLAMFVVFRIGSHVPVPGVDARILAEFFQGDDIFGFLNVIGGGALSRFTIFAMGNTEDWYISYINISYIIYGV